MFRSDVRRKFVLDTYRRKAERDYEEMEIISKGIDAVRKSRKKYRNSNCFVDTRLSYLFPLKAFDREQAINIAVRNMVSGREGLFVLTTNRGLPASDVLKLYRSRGRIKTAFRDLKHGIDWRPARCKKETAIKGRILISFLALFCLSMVGFLYPDYRDATAGSLCEELSSFSLTVLVREGEQKRRIFSNFGHLIRLIRGQNRPDRVPQAPGQATIDRFSV